MIPGYLKRHPAVLLLLLSPGIPEYISGSSPINDIVLNPAMFVFQVLANLGLYGPGVLLIREAAFEWRKGWASVLLLGAAYGILEEGIALSTLFNPAAQPVGKLGVYGHWLGVSWVWLAGILPVHMIFSISLPILLLGLAVPETRDRCLLRRRGRLVASAVLGIDVSILFVFVTRGEHFWMGWSVFVGSLGAILLLVGAASRVPAEAIRALSESPRLRANAAAAIGALFYASVLLVEGFGMSEGIPPAVDFILVVVVQAVFLALVLGFVGSSQKNQVALSLGLVVPIAAIGLLSEIALPLILLPDVLYLLFLRGVWKEVKTPSPDGPEIDTLST